MPKPKKHRRTGPKQARAGCMLCKPHKLSSAVTAARRKAERAWRADWRVAR